MQPYDVVVIGSGMGGLSAAGLLAKAGMHSLVLEANYLPGGCSSSYWHKGYIFETGATTLMGFDPGQPLHTLTEALGLELKKLELLPSMEVWLDGERIVRYKDREQWLEEAIRVFGQPVAQRKFWKLAFELSDYVWRVSGRNLTFPPSSIADLTQLALQNHPLDFPKLRYLFRSTANVLKAFGLGGNERFLRFVNEQLLITAQSGAADTPMLFAAPALCYTNYSNYYLPGGLIRLPMAVMGSIGSNGGDVHLRERVTGIQQEKGNLWRVTTDKTSYVTRRVVSNIPLWNLAQLGGEPLQRWVTRHTRRIENYWGAYTMGVVIDSKLAPNLSLHHQIHLPAGQTLPEGCGRSVFVSLSDPQDTERAPAGKRVLALSTHAYQPSGWLNQPRESYTERKARVRDAMIDTLEQNLPGFAQSTPILEMTNTPHTWQDWIYRHEGTVGGIPQSMKRPLYTWPGALTPFKGLYLTGDTVYPGQGIPGVTLGGIIAAERILKGN